MLSRFLCTAVNYTSCLISSQEVLQVKESIDSSDRSSLHESSNGTMYLTQMNHFHVSQQICVHRCPCCSDIFSTSELDWKWEGVRSWISCVKKVELLKRIIRHLLHFVFLSLSWFNKWFKYFLHRSNCHDYCNQAEKAVLQSQLVEAKFTGSLGLDPLHQIGCKSEGTGSPSMQLLILWPLIRVLWTHPSHPGHPGHILWELLLKRPSFLCLRSG